MSDVMKQARGYIQRIKAKSNSTREYSSGFEQIDPEGLRALADLGVTLTTSSRNGFTLSITNKEKIT